MRMFAGPNGETRLWIVFRVTFWGPMSTRTKLKKENGHRVSSNLAAYNVTSTPTEALSFFTNSSFLQSAGLSADAQKLDFGTGRLLFGRVRVNAYFASVAADFLRQKLLEKQISF